MDTFIARIKDPNNNGEEAAEGCAAIGVGSYTSLVVPHFRATGMSNNEDRHSGKGAITRVFQEPGVLCHNWPGMGRIYLGFSEVTKS